MGGFPLVKPGGSLLEGCFSGRASGSVLPRALGLPLCLCTWFPLGASPSGTVSKGFLGVGRCHPSGASGDTSFLLSPKYSLSLSESVGKSHCCFFFFFNNIYLRVFKASLFSLAILELGLVFHCTFEMRDFFIWTLRLVFFGCTSSIKKFLGQGSNPHHKSDSAGSFNR